jgi:leukotriene-A4 hydrolase
VPQRIPAYLLAIAAGDIGFESMSRRTGVYAEPSVVRAAAREFEDTEKMMEAAERLYGPYRWERYDILVLPPSFPFGGMENPRLTFATPTVLAGDKSLVSLIAHELAHSWSGNLVTNATWRDFWLNEGFATFMTAAWKEHRWGRAAYDHEMDLARRRLASAARAGYDKPLAWGGTYPSLGLRRAVQYSKGALFLDALRARLGEDRFWRAVRVYTRRHAGGTVTSADFEAAVEAAAPGVAGDLFRTWVHDN